MSARPVPLPKHLCVQGKCFLVKYIGMAAIVAAIWVFVKQMHKTGKLGSRQTILQASPHLQSLQQNKSGTLDESQKLSGRHVVLVHSDTCAPCQAVMPIFAQLIASHPDTYHVIEKGQLTAADYKKYKIEGYPTILKFINGKVSTYTGDRSYDAILNWA